MWDAYGQQVSEGDVRAISRCISLIENETNGYEQLLIQSTIKDVPVIGITGPPGAGKSTLTDGLIKCGVEANKKVAVLCIDPSSAFTNGSILGDRIRMNRWYNEPNVFIRSLATRGSLGGLHPMVLEITDLLKTSIFDLIIIETVGIGQSEIAIVEIADVTVLVLVPESGDDIQTMKAGVMEIADVFVINKSDRPGADAFIKNLTSSFPNGTDIPVLKTIASTGSGVPELYASIIETTKSIRHVEKKKLLLARKAYQLIIKKRMADVNFPLLTKQLEAQSGMNERFNLYAFVNDNY